MLIKLGDYVKIRTGKLNANSSDEDGIYPFFTCAREVSYINKYAFDCECVLIAGNGELNVKYYEGKFNAYQRTYVIEVLNKSVISPKFLFHFLSNYIEKLRNKSIGGVIKYIRLNHLTDIEFPLFDLQTQNKVVTILNKTNALILKRQKSIELVDTLLKSQFIDMFGDPVFNPKKWEIKKLKSALYSIESGWSPICENKRRLSTNEWAVLSQSAISKKTFLADKNKLLPQGTVIKKEITAQKGDLLFSRKNSEKFVGAAAYVFDDYEKLLLPDTIFKFKLNPEIISPLYLLHLINDDNFSVVVKNLKAGAASSMPNISKAKLFELEIPVPELNLQKKFDKIVQEFYKKKNKLLISLRNLEELLKSISQKAFHSELNFDVSVELDAILEIIDTSKAVNDLSPLTSDITYLNNFIVRLNEGNFENQKLYERAKYTAFQLLKESDSIFQVYDDKLKILRLVLK